MYNYICILLIFFMGDIFYLLSDTLHLISIKNWWAIIKRFTETLLKLSMLNFLEFLNKDMIRIDNSLFPSPKYCMTIKRWLENTRHTCVSRHWMPLPLLGAFSLTISALPNLVLVHSFQTCFMAADSLGLSGSKGPSQQSLSTQEVDWAQFLPRNSIPTGECQEQRVPLTYTCCTTTMSVA